MALADPVPHFHRPVVHIVARLKADDANNLITVERTGGEIGKAEEVEEVVLARI